MVLNISHEDKKKYKESLKPKTVRVRTKRTTTMSDKLKNQAFKKFGDDPKSKGVEEDIMCWEKTQILLSRMTTLNLMRYK